MWGTSSIGEALADIFHVRSNCIPVSVLCEKPEVSVLCEEQEVSVLCEEHLQSCLSVICRKHLVICKKYPCFCSKRGATAFMFNVMSISIVFEEQLYICSKREAPAYQFYVRSTCIYVLCEEQQVSFLMRSTCILVSVLCEEHLLSSISILCRKHLFFICKEHLYLCSMWGAPAYLFCIRRTGLVDLRQRLQTRVATTPPNILSEIY